MKVSLLTLAFALSGFAHADSNSCDDYIARHDRRDLVATSMSFQNKQFDEPYQEVTLGLKNVGESEFSPGPSTWMSLNIKGNLRKIQVPRPIGSMQTIFVKVAVDPNLLRNCETVPVSIDLEHTVGQWGCMVWNDDSAKLLARQAGGRLCRIIPNTIVDEF